MTYLDATAEVSPCGIYRYDLRRVWDRDRRPALFVMLNPSTADGDRDDPTVRRCVSFARQWGCGGLVVVNLFALRATDPRRLYAHPDPVGPHNDRHIRMWAALCDVRVAAGGVHGVHRGRDTQVRMLFGPAALNLPLCHLGTTKEGLPRHPLYLPNGMTPQPYPAPFED